MDHATVRDWIDEAFFAPRMRDADDAAARGVRTHLAACSDCAGYDEQTRRAALKLDLARGPAPEVRARVMGAAARLGRAREDAPSRGARSRSGGGLAWRFAAAMLVVAIVGAGAGAWWASSARPDPAMDHLADAVAMMSTLASAPDAHEMVLHDASGIGSGMAVVSPSSHQMAVFATHLPPGAGYHCYLERAGKRTWIGQMLVTTDVQFWAGEMDPEVTMLPGDLLVVAADATGPAVLNATL